MTTVSDTRAIRLLPASVEPAGRQLAASPALLAGVEQSGRASMRWYQFSPRALLLGSSQRIEATDLAACAAAGVPIHRRRSGGGAVLADPGLLLLDLALPPDDPLYLGDVTESYRWFGEVWAAALRELGLDARVVSVAEARAETLALDPLLRPVCFAGRSPYEVVVGHHKLVGLAQVRRRGGALLEAGVYLSWPPERTAALMAAPEQGRATLARLLAERVAGLAQLPIREPIAAVAVERAVERALERVAGLQPTPDDWSAHERAAREAATPGYAALENCH